MNLEHDPEKDFIQLKDNHIPKGSVMLESLFECEKVNIGSEDNPKWVNLGKFCNESKRNRFLELLKEFRNVFSWSYEYLKDFCHEKFTHEIPLKLNVAPFYKKL